MTNTTNTRKPARISAVELITRLAVALAVIGCLFALSHDEPATAPSAPTTAPTSDLEGEVWWTTTDCPAGVEVPCLDPTVDPALVPADVAAQIEQLVEAEWSCIQAVGVPMADGTVRVEHEQLLQCRQNAYTGQVEEDDPRFDCRIHGNRTCGEGATVGELPVHAGTYPAPRATFNPAAELDTSRIDDLRSVQA